MQSVGASSFKGVAPQVAVDHSSDANGAGGVAMNSEKDEKQAQSAPKFGEVWQSVQARYGAKPEKGREIKKNLGKDDFLKIMITQMKNQDPTSPFKAEQMATEMAQFTSVEQLQNINQNMAKMITANQPLERLAMTNMIGKTVTIDRERFSHVENQTSTLNFALPKDAKNVKLQIIDEHGEQVYERDLGPIKAGDQEYAWDGLKSNSLPTKTGNFIFKIDAVDKNDRRMNLNSQGQSQVVGVSFEGNEAMLMVGDINHPQKITMKNVIRVDSNGGAGEIPGAQSLRAAVGKQAIRTPMISNLTGDGADQAEQSGGARAPAFTGAHLGLGMGAPAETGEAGTNPNEGESALRMGMTPSSLESQPSEIKRGLGQYKAAANTNGQNNSTDDIEKNTRKEEKGFPNGLDSVNN